MFPVKHPRAVFALLVIAALLTGLSTARAEDDMLNPFGDAAEKNVRLSVRLTSETVNPGELFGVVLDFDIPEDWHLYRKDLKFQWAEPAGAEAVDVMYPTAKHIQDPFGPEMVDVFEGKATVTVVFRVLAEEGKPIKISGTVGFQACSGQLCEFGDKKIHFELASGSRGGEVITQEPPKTFTPQGERVESIDRERTTWAWADIVIAFIAGLGLSFTPCVLPMIPVTSGIIRGYAGPGKLSALASSLIYALGIALVYGVIGVGVAFVGVQVQSILNAPYVRIPVAGLLVVLALGMFGVFQIQMPASIQSKAQQIGGRAKKNKLGLFLLGMAGGLIVGPCVAPVISGLLLRVGTSGNIVLGFLTMFACGLGISALLVAGGTFTGLIPRRGVWMLLVEYAFGFILLWAALYFVSYLMPVGIYFLGIAAIFAGAAVFFSGVQSNPVFRRILVILLVLAALGFAGGGGYLIGSPPKHAFAQGGAAEARAALSSGRPAIIDFSAPWCVACGELDDYTFSDPRIIEELKRFQAVKVNVDEHKDLAGEFGVRGIPAVRIYDSDGTERKDLSFSGFKNADDVLARLKQVK